MTSSPNILATRFTEMVGVRYPIVQGGMGPPSTSPALVSAVANAGGLGVLGISGYSAAQVEEMVGQIRAATSAPFGLNLLLFRSSDEAISTMLAQRPAVASLAWATFDQPLERIFAQAHEAGAIVMHQVSDVAEARRGAAAGADIIVAQGTEGGGHVGVLGTFPLVPQVVDAVAPLPVLAAGGIADGRGLAASIMLGAEGALLGTRFLATDEAPLAPRLKQVIIDSDGSDTDLTEIPDIISGRVWPGALARTWRNDLLERWSAREWELRQRLPEVAAGVAAARAAEDVQQMPLLFGQDAGLIHQVEPVAVLMARIVAEASRLLAGRGSGS